MSQRRAYLLDRIANRKRRRGNVMPLQKFLGEALARLQLRRRAASAQTSRQPRRVNSSTTPSVSGNSGPTTVRSGCSRVASAVDRIQTLQIRGKAFRVVRDPAIARRAIKLRNPRRLPQLPHQRMLAPAATEDKNFHKSEKIRLGVHAGMLSNARVYFCSSNSRLQMKNIKMVILSVAILQAERRSSISSILARQPDSLNPARSRFSINNQESSINNINYA